jgi:hypothetical protein
MRFNFASLFILFVSLFLVSCKGSSSGDNIDSDDSTKSNQETIEPLEVSWMQLEADSVKAETLIVFEGYIGDIGMFVEQISGKMRIPIYERRNQKAGFKVHLYLPVGTGKNQMKELPAEFLPTDVQIFAEDNSILTKGSRVRITAIKSETVSPGFISADVVKIESLNDDFDSEIFASAIPLTSAMMKDTSLQNVYCYIDGKVDIPSIVFSYTNEIALDLKNSTLKDISTISVPLGEGPSTMNDFPDNYTTADLILRDYLGKEVKYKSVVRLYGVWERYTFESSTPGNFYLEEIAVKK